MQGTKRVLIFDDDQDLLSIFHFLFEDMGWEVFAFLNCDEIVEKAMELNPALIVMDNWIPSIGGIKATQLVKNDSTLKKIPVIYVSANNDIAALSKKAGADAYIAKPFEFDTFYKIVLSLVNNT